MKEAGWLRQSLLEARRETEGIPEWAKEMLRAWNAHYGPGSTSTARSGAHQHATAARPPETADGDST